MEKYRHLCDIDFVTIDASPWCLSGLFRIETCALLGNGETLTVDLRLTEAESIYVRDALLLAYPLHVAAPASLPLAHIVT